MADEKKSHMTNGNINADSQGDDIEEYNEIEYLALDSELDRLDNCLDVLENWNDSLNLKMREFLETMQKSRENTENEKPKDVANHGMELDK